METFETYEDAIKSTRGLKGEFKVFQIPRNEQGRFKVERIDKIKSDDFHILCQELYETAGNASQLDCDFINLLYHKISKFIPDIKEVL